MNEKAIIEFSEHQSIDLINDIPVPCLLVDEDGFIIKINTSCTLLKEKGISFENGFSFNFFTDTKDANIFNKLLIDLDLGCKKGKLVGLQLEKGKSTFVHININPYHFKKNKTSYLLTLQLVDDYIGKDNPIRQQRDFYKNLLDNLPADIAVFDSDFKYTYINKNAIKDDSIRSWLIGKDDYEYCEFRNVPAEIAKNRQQRLLNIKENKIEYSFEEKIIKNNIPAYHLRVMKPVFEIENELSYIIGYGINITKQKESELQNQQQAFAIESSYDGIAILDSDQKYVYMNQAHASLFGYENRNDLIGETWSIFYEESELERIIKDLIPKLQTDKSWRGETKARRKNKTYINLDVSLSVMENGGLICIIRDITERIERENEVNKLAVVASQSNSLVYISDKFKKIEWINNAVEIFIGFNLKEIEGKDLEDIFCKNLNDQEVTSYFRNSINNNKRFIGDVQVRKRNNEICWLTINATPIFDQENKFVNYILVANDISLLKDTEENYKLLLQKEKELNKMKSQFISLASHEFRTPLTSILSSIDIIDILNSNPETDSSKINKHLIRITDEVDRMTNIMNNIFQIGKAEVFKPKFEPQRIDISNLFDEIINEVKFKNNDLKIIFHQTGIPIKLNCDKNLMAHILNNLIDNAIKYSKQEEEIIVKIAYSKRNIIISVKDNGIGIPKDEQAHLFTSFYRASNSNNIAGTGLGLVVVKELMKLHGGEVEIESEENKGCTVKLIFKTK